MCGRGRGAAGSNGVAWPSWCGDDRDIVQKKRACGCNKAQQGARGAGTARCDRPVAAARGSVVRATKSEKRERES